MERDGIDPNASKEATGLFVRYPIRNSGTAAQRGIAEGRLPVPGGDELGTIQELGAIPKFFC